MRLRSLAVGLRLFAGLFFASNCLAQSIDLPLQLVQSTAGARLVANIGINGQSPLPYLFDTGSTMFNAFYTPNAFGGNFTSSVANLPTGFSYSYAKHTDTITVVGVPSLAFYPSTSSSTGVTLNALSPSGAPSNFLMGAVTQRDGVAITNQTPALEAVAGGFQGLYGTFGAGNFALCRVASQINTQCDASAKNTFVIGGVLGQATSGASAGYIVAANGQPLSGLVTNGATNPGSNVNGPQVGQSVTSCSPCVILGLTPALRAQFKSINTMPWVGGAPAGVTGFPNSGAPSSSEFGINMNFAIGPAGSGQVTFNGQPTLLDTGTQNFELRNPSVNPSAYGAASAGVYQLANGTLVSIAGSSGATPTSYQAFPDGSFPFPGVYATSVDTTGSNNNTVGLGRDWFNALLPPFPALG